MLCGLVYVDGCWSENAVPENLLTNMKFYRMGQPVESFYQSACKSDKIKSYVDPKPQFLMESVNGPKPHPRDECHSSGQVLKACVPVPFVPVDRQK